MKSEKGITLASLGIYIVVILIALITLTTITTYFRRNVNEFNTKTTMDLEFDKFNLYFIEEVKKTNNGIYETSSVTKLVFLSGNTYEFKENSIILNDNIKIAERIDNCSFTWSVDENEKQIVTVEMTIGETTRTNQYILSNQTNEDLNNEDYIYGYKRVEGQSPMLLINSVETNLKDYKIYGNESGLGDEVTDTSSSNYGKYKVTIKITRATKNAEVSEESTDIDDYTLRNRN